MNPIPFNDQCRLDELEASQILDTEKDPIFDFLTDTACRQFHVPIALISLVDEHRQWFKSGAGLEERQTERSIAFCAHAIMSDKPLVILNTTEDDRFAHNQLVVEDPKIRFYAGAPMISGNGFRLGTFCIVDTAPRREFSRKDREALEQMAEISVRLIEQNGGAGSRARSLSADEIAENAFTDLFSYLAHEVRSPLANIGAVSRAFANEAFGRLGNDQYKEFAGLLEENSVHIMEILDRMLDFGKMQHGDVKLIDEQNLISEVVAAGIRQIQQSHSHRTIDQNLPASLDGYRLTGDKTFLTQILVNLIDNACKYGDEATQIKITASLFEDGDMGLTVEDRGYGLTADEIVLAMRPYRRVVRQVDNSPKGIGIGLPLAKRLVELHGGTIELKPRKGGGIRAIVKLPAYRVIAA